MALQCPNCSKKLSDTADPAEPPAFCMYCGHKLNRRVPPVSGLLSPEGVSDSQTAAYEPQPEVTRTQVSTATNLPAQESTPSVIAGYRLLRLLGSGGMGQVYEAQHQGSGQRVAIKLLSGRLAANSASVERFRQEGRVASQITHPHCVFVLRADTDAGRPYIMMELMPGRTLKDLVDDEGPRPVGEAIRRMLDVIDGLIQAHELGVIHRDVKPSNCFLTSDDRVKIGDFGLSKSLSNDQPARHLTHSGAFLGTVLFASPEQIRGEPVGYDSDVYAVCATLYYLLVGRAPFQHESLTASLAKAVSEAPPSIRRQRDDVPVELERIILRGLDRDRQKRWATLEELRRALEDIQPERQQPARPRSLILAYLIDTAILTALAVPLELARAAATGFASFGVFFPNFNFITMLTTLLYFTLFEGLLGWTPGKRALRLRVTKLGGSGPPGLIAAFIRTVIFNLMWLGVLWIPDLAIEHWPRGAAGVTLGLGCTLLSGLALLIQFKHTPSGWRGLHDRLSQTRVLSRPLTNRLDNLESLYPIDIWERVQPSRLPLPAEVGGFTIIHQLAQLDSGGLVWLAEDRSLARRVLIHLLPLGMDDPIRGETPLSRPHRLRILGHGMILWDGSPRAWVAQIAPTGSPLADCVSPVQPLPWANARLVLDQLVQELHLAEQDDTLPSSFQVEQVWVEPNGRLQLLDFPLSGAGQTQSDCASDTPLTLIRATTTLALEGSARTSPEPIAAPLPSRAHKLMNRIMQDDNLPLAELHRELHEELNQPAVVTAGMRAAHLSLQAAMLLPGLVVLIFLSGFYSVNLAVANAQQRLMPRLLNDVLRSPSERAALLARLQAEPMDEGRRRAVLSRLEEDLPGIQRDLNRYLLQLQLAGEFADQTLIAPERKLLKRIESIWSDLYEMPEANEVDLKFLVQFVTRGQPSVSELDPEELRQRSFWRLLLIFVVVPLIWSLFGVLFRGGLSYTLAGLAVVNRTGQPLGRFWCLVREWIVWLPYLCLALLSLWIQTQHPFMCQTRALVWLLSLGLLLTYVIVAIRQPSRPPHDQLLGSTIVPR